MKRTISTLLITVALLPWVAQAHTHLEKATPADGSTVATAPKQITLMFSEAATLTALSIQRVGDKEWQKLRPLPKEPAKSFQVALPKLVPGSYTVKYRVYSTDSQVIPGTTRFTISPDAKPTHGKMMDMKGMDMRGMGIDMEKAKPASPPTGK